MSRSISSTKVLLGSDLVPATIIFSIESGKILHIENRVVDEDDPILRLYNVLRPDHRNVSPLVVMPGIVDAHVHLNEPGRTEWEGFATGTKAAASGGVTTVIDMPLNAIPPTTTVANFNLKINAARGQTWVDVGFWGGLIPTNVDHLIPLISMGVRGFKAFMIDSGVDEFPAITPKHIMKAMAKVRGLPTLLMFHAEMQPHRRHGPAFSVHEVEGRTPKLVANEEHAKFHAEFLLELDEDDEYEQTLDETPVLSDVQQVTEEIDDIDLGMSASFINRAPQGVVKILASENKGRHQQDHENCKLPHNHAGSINHSVLSDEQARALAKSPYLVGSEPIFGKYAKMAHHNYHEELDEEYERESPFNRKDYRDLKNDSTIDTPLLLAQQDDSMLADIDPTTYAAFLASRPDNFETTAIAEIVNCSLKEPTVPMHIVHLATHEAIPLLRAAKARNLPISAETCFHYLSLTAEKISNCSTHFKCCPPIRTDSNRKLLWNALRRGIISTVVSDHSPCTPDLKGLERGDFFSAWGGISSVGFGLPILYTEGQKLSSPITLAEISTWCSWNTSKQVGLSHRKGKIAVGYDADFLIFNPEESYIVKNDEVYFKNKLTAYDGMKFQGRVTETIVRGNPVYAFSKGHSDIPMGTLLLEPRID